MTSSISSALIFTFLQYFSCSLGSKLFHFRHSFSPCAFSYPITYYCSASCLICLDAKHCGVTKTSHSTQSLLPFLSDRIEESSCGPWWMEPSLLLHSLDSFRGCQCDSAAILKTLQAWRPCWKSIGHCKKEWIELKNIDVALLSIVSRKYSHT